MSLVALTANLTVAAALLASVLWKLRNFYAFQEALSLYSPLILRDTPSATSKSAATAIILVELMLGMGLLTVAPRFRLEIFLATGTLLLTFAGVITINLLRDRDIPCGCGGSNAAATISYWHVTRNLLLLGLLAIGYRGDLPLYNLLTAHPLMAILVSTTALMYGHAVLNLPAIAQVGASLREA